MAVQFAREQTFSTQAFGPSGKAKKQQFDAIEAGINSVITVAESFKANRKSVACLISGQWRAIPAERFSEDVETLNAWVESNRTRRRGRTAKIPPQKRMVTTARTMKKLVARRRLLAGIAKGGWIGAGREAAKFQTGGDRITIGKNFFSYAQKHAHYGRAKKSGGPLSPSITLHNTARHTASRNVVAPTQVAKNLVWAKRKTLTWYNRAAKRALDK